MLTKSLFKIDSQRERVDQNSRVVEDLHYRYSRERLGSHIVRFLCLGYCAARGFDVGIGWISAGIDLSGASDEDDQPGNAGALRRRECNDIENCFSQKSHEQWYVSVNPGRYRR